MDIHRGRVFVTADPPEARQPGCSLCWIDGIWSRPIKGWEGFPICREHVAETLARVGGFPPVTTSTGVVAPAILQ